MKITCDTFEISNFCISLVKFTLCLVIFESLLPNRFSFKTGYKCHLKKLFLSIHLVLCSLQVKNFDKFHFKPSELVKNIAQIVISLGSEKDFCLAVVSDGRSYTKDLYAQAVKVLE